MLLATELASNAIEHGGAPALLDACVRPHVVRVSVDDPSPVIPQPGPVADGTTEELSERGRGLLLIAALASRWGAEPRPHGKTVWFEIDRH